MGFIELIILSIGLAMDAFAVAICKGLSMSKMNWKKASIIGLYFGGFQALMPLVGYLLGINFQEKITSIDHWIAFLLLGIIGINMIREAFGSDEEDVDSSLSFKNMFVMAVATSIDALAVGVTFAFEFSQASTMLLSCGTIGITTFAISAIGVKIGNVFGVRFKSKAELLGGVILIFLGVKILIEAFI